MENNLPTTQPIIDLTHETQERALLICGALAGCGAYVLHGSNVKPVIPRLQPRQANDAAKISGNHCAVYASIDVDVVLMHAVLDTLYLRQCLGSYTVGYRGHAGRKVFRVTDNLYQLFKHRDSKVCSDGFIYVLDKSCFVRAPESPSEFYAVRPLLPERVLKVAASIGDYLFQVDTLDGRDTVRCYDDDEIRALTAGAN